MAQQHPAFKAPDDVNARVWRYMDFPKFIAMCEYNGVFFARADRLGDAWEGTSPRPNAEAMAADLRRAGMESFAGKLREDMLWMRQTIGISCWHLNNHETSAMWSTYALPRESVAVESTFRRLSDHLPDPVFLGAVRYIDHATTRIPEPTVFNAYMHKRLEHRQDQEVRAIIWELPTEGHRVVRDAVLPEMGWWRTVDLQQILTRVVLAPSAPSWFHDLTGRILSRFGLDIPVARSALDERPYG